MNFPTNPNHGQFARWLLLQKTVYEIVKTRLGKECVQLIAEIDEEEEKVFLKECEQCELPKITHFELNGTSCAIIDCGQTTQEKEKVNDILKTDSRKKMLIKIVNFLEVECNIEDINIDLEENLASEPRSKVFQNILYKDYLLKKMFKRLFTDRFAAKIKNILSSFNKKTINDKKSFNMKNNINKEYLKWNNDIVHETEKITNLNLSNWYYDI